MLGFVEEATGRSVNENLRGIPDRMLNGRMNGCLGLFWVYIFSMMVYNTR